MPKVLYLVMLFVSSFQRTCHVLLFDIAKVILFFDISKFFMLKNVNVSNKFSKTDGFCHCWLDNSSDEGNTISNIQTAINSYIHLRLHPFYKYFMLKTWNIHFFLYYRIKHHIYLVMSQCDIQTCDFLVVFLLM